MLETNRLHVIIESNEIGSVVGVVGIQRTKIPLVRWWLRVKSILPGFLGGEGVRIAGFISFFLNIP